MSDSLLPYYERELVAIRKLAAEFAEANPKVAGRLRVSAETADDPDVERLLEGMAFLAGRVQQRLDEEAPDLSDALLDLLCPHLLAPIPSMTTVQLSPRPGDTGAARVVRGTPMQTQAVRGEVLHYQTCHESVLWPVTIAAAKLASLPVQAPHNPQAIGVAAVLRLTLTTSSPDVSFESLALDRVRIHLRGSGAMGIQVLELLCTGTVSIALASGPSDPYPTILGREHLQHVGFAPEEAALPWPQRAFHGHRLLSEYFAFPEKFLYLELTGLDARTRVQAAGELDVYLYLDRTAPELERALGRDNFLLGATPAVNLFRQTAEPVAMDGTQDEWLVVPDSRRPTALEVYSVESVRFSRPDTPQPHRVPHFQRLRNEQGSEPDAEGMSWLARRLVAPGALGGTETRLQLRDSLFNPDRPADGVLSIDTLCCNRDLPTLLPYGGGQPRLRVSDPTAPTAGAECLSPPTPTLRRQLRERSGWRLVSHLVVNHLGVTGGVEAAQVLREMLRLHALSDTPEARLALDGIVSLDARPGIARVPGARPGSFTRGIDIVLTFEPQAWTAGGLYLLASILERFFALQVSINSFVRTRVYVRGRLTPVAEWPARTGTRVLL